MYIPIRIAMWCFPFQSIKSAFFLLLFAITGGSRELTGKISMWWHLPVFHIYTPSHAFCKGGKNSDKAVLHNQEINLCPERDFVMAYSVRVSVCLWQILSSIGQPRVCYMERRKHNFFFSFSFFKEGLRNMVQAMPAAVLGAVGSESGRQRSSNQTSAWF